MSPEQARLLVKVSGGAIQVIRNGVDAEVTYIGAPQQEAKGHWMGKAVIESLMHSLHLSLMRHDGQRGATYKKQPASLGYTGYKNTPRKGSLAAEAEKLAQIELAFNRRLKLNCGLLWASQLIMIFKDAVAAHNAERGHNYQGHGFLTEVEVAPGVWEVSA